jgi:hypothetical protein
LRIALLAILLLPAIAPAQDISLPLGGNYRVGRYMPVQFAASPGRLRLAADGAVTTIIQSPVGGIAPFLITASPVRNASFTQALHELQADEKLIGMATDAPDIGSVIFPGEKTISVSLDPVHPTPGPPAAWQSLDALVLDANSPALKDTATLNLLSGGTIIVIRAGTPDAKYGGVFSSFDRGYWILQPPIALSAVGEDSYGPISGFVPRHDADYLRHVVVMGLVFSILLVGASLWNSRRNVLLAAGLALITLFAVPIWGSAQLPIIAAQGVIQENDTFPMSDTWLYQMALKPCRARLPFPGTAWPMPSADAGAQDMTLVCDGTGKPLGFQYNLRPDLPAAFVFRSATAAAETAGLSTPLTSPLRTLLSPHYPGLQAIGEARIDSTGEPGAIQWPTVVLARSDAMPSNLNPASGRDSSNK